MSGIISTQDANSRRAVTPAEVVGRSPSIDRKLRGPVHRRAIGKPTVRALPVGGRALPSSAALPGSQRQLPGSRVRRAKFLAR